MVLGPESNVIPLGQFGTEFTPDEHMSYFRRADGSSLVYWAGGTFAGPGETVAMTTSDFSSFTPLVLKGGNAVSVFSPSGPGTSSFDADYAGPGTVLRAANGSDLLMIYHAENHLFNGIDYPTAPFYAAIGLARSADGGATWTRQGEIITAMTPKPAGTRLASRPSPWSSPGHSPIGSATVGAGRVYRA